MEQSEFTGALDGITVLDCGIILQGPQSGQMLSDLGAHVIKIEQPGIGDTARWLPVGFPDDMRAPWYIAANRGKRSVTLDLRTDQGREIFLKMAETADVVLSNFATGTMDRWGLSYEALHARNSQIVVATANAYGPVGPDALRKGADLGGQAQGGLVNTTANLPAGARPVAVTIADHIGAQNLTIAILAALMARPTIGRGQHVDVSLFGGQIFAQAPELTGHFLSGHQTHSPLPGHPMLSMFYGVFATADGHIALVGVPGEAKRAELWDLLGAPEHVTNEGFNAPVLSPSTQAELFTILNNLFTAKTTEQWCDLFRAHEIRYAPVNSYADIEADEGAYLNGYLQKVDHPEWGEVTQIGSPIRMSHTPTQPGRFAPELGQNTEEVLLEYGWNWDDLGELREQGVI